MDEKIDEIHAPQAAAHRGDMPPKPAGSKALMRLIAPLDRCSLHELSETVLETKVSAEEQEAVAASRAQFSPALPARSENGDTPTTSRIRRPRRHNAEELPAAEIEIAEEYRKAALQQTSAPIATGLQWRPLGSWPVSNGQTYGSSRVNLSVRVSAIAIRPANAARILCGSANGGVWESFDRGASWGRRSITNDADSFRQ